MKNTSLCYIENEGNFLMLHRIKKKNDINKDKWVGIGGKFEYGETPEECMKREVYEETGLIIKNYRYCGIVTFVSDIWGTEYMHLFTSDKFEGDIHECDEGMLEWVKKENVKNLSIWEGDKVFLKLMADKIPFFFTEISLRWRKADGMYIKRKSNIKQI
jgi:8-oxo-dGTP diphosphatase